MTLELFTATGALHRRLDRVPARRAAALAAVRRAARVRGGDHGPARARRRDSRRTPTSTWRTDRRRRRRPTVLDRLSGDGYRVRNLAVGVVGATGAGVASALLGIGGGIIKVPLMHLAMGVPAAGRDGDEQHDDRDHRRGQRRHLPHPRRHRPVRRGPDGHRRLPRRDGRLAAGPPGRPALPPGPVRCRARLHGRSRCCCG